MRRSTFIVVFVLSASLFAISPAHAGACVDTVAVDDEGYTPMVKFHPVQNGLLMCWTNGGTTAHTATSDNGMFDTGSIAASSTGTASPYGSGTFPYHCSIHPGLTGTLKIRPVADQTSITLGDSFVLTAGDAFTKGIPWDVQKRFGDGSWRTFESQTYVASLTLRPGKAGTFRYRGRTWSGENHSGWSPARKVVVEPA